MPINISSSLPTWHRIPQCLLTFGLYVCKCVKILRNVLADHTIAQTITEVSSHENSYLHIINPLCVNMSQDLSEWALAPYCSIINTEVQAMGLFQCHHGLYMHRLHMYETLQLQGRISLIFSAPKSFLDDTSYELE